MGIEYTTTPRNFDELCDSIRGQVERARELSIRDEQLDPAEMVELTSESFLAVLDRIEQLTAMLMQQAILFSQVNDIFEWLFKHLGIDLDAINLDESN
jgi:predicted Zn-dependent peptidase